MSSNNGCRWCGFVQDPYELIIDSVGCEDCGASNSASMNLNNGIGGTVSVWHNPDNSVFIELTKGDDKTARYILSSELLMRTGALQLFDKNPNGRKGND